MARGPGGGAAQPHVSKYGMYHVSVSRISITYQYITHQYHVSEVSTVQLYVAGLPLSRHCHPGRSNLRHTGHCSRMFGVQDVQIKQILLLTCQRRLAVHASSPYCFELLFVGGAIWRMTLSAARMARCASSSSTAVRLRSQLSTGSPRMTWQGAVSSWLCPLCFRTRPGRARATLSSSSLLLWGFRRAGGLAIPRAWPPVAAGRP